MADWTEDPLSVLVGAAALLVWAGVKPVSLACEFVLDYCGPITGAIYGEEESWTVDRLIVKAIEDESRRSSKQLLKIFTDKASKVNHRSKNNKPFYLCPQIYQVYETVKAYVELEADDLHLVTGVRRLPLRTIPRPVLNKTKDGWWEWSTQKAADLQKVHKAPELSKSFLGPDPFPAEQTLRKLIVQYNEGEVRVSGDAEAVRIDRDKSGITVYFKEKAVSKP